MFLQTPKIHYVYTVKKLKPAPPNASTAAQKTNTGVLVSFHWIVMLRWPGSDEKGV
jgi:hypothetical protein